MVTADNRSIYVAQLDLNQQLAMAPITRGNTVAGSLVREGKDKFDTAIFQVADTNFANRECTTN